MLKCDFNEVATQICRIFSEHLFPIDTRRRFNVYKTSIRRRRRLIDVEMTSCVYWVIKNTSG